MLYFFASQLFCGILFGQASDLDGEVDLSSCYDVTEFPVQRNYGFQILVSGVQPPSVTPAHPIHPPPTLALNSP